MVLWGRCWEGAGAPAFWPWVQVIRGYVQGQAEDLASLRHDLGAGAADIAQLVPALHDRIPDLPVPPPLEPEAARFRLFDSLAGFLRTAAARRPLLLVLDDLHWADVPSLALLRFMSRELDGAEGTGPLVVGSYRHTEVATTTQRECVRVLRAARGPHTAEPVPDLETIPDEQSGMAEEELLVAERHAALREALARLPPRCQRLIGKLIEDPPLTYAQISASLGLPVGSIGPLRGRCLDRLRSDPAVAALINADAAPAGVSDPRSSRGRAFAGCGSTTARALPPR